MRRWNLVLSVILILGIPYLFLDTFSFPPSLRPRIPGPDYWPRLILIFLFALAILLLGSNLRPSAGGETIRSGRASRVLPAMAAMGIFFVLLPFLGYAVCTFFLLLVLLRIVGIKTVKHLVMIPFGFIVVVYLFFTWVFGVQLPKGTLLWFL